MLQQIIQSEFNNQLEKQLINLFHKTDLPLHFNKTGNKEFTNYQRISLIVIFRRENKPIRDFVAWLGESKWVSWLGLKKIPKKSTFHDWLDLFDMKLIRNLINFSVDKTNLKVTAIDGSGIQTNFQSPYYQKRLKELGEKIKSSYHKLDIIVDVYGKKQILDYSFLLKNRHDSFVAKKLLKKIKFKRCKILADKGYPNYDFIEMSRIKQNNFISPPKNYGGKCRHNNFKRRRKIANFESNKVIYRRRVIVEGVFSSLKRKQCLKLRSRLSYMKKREMGWHVLFYNVRRNIAFDGVNFEESLSFFILILEIYVFPDRAFFYKNMDVRREDINDQGVRAIRFSYMDCSKKVVETSRSPAEIRQKLETYTRQNNSHHGVSRFRGARPSIRDDLWDEFENDLKGRLEPIIWIGYNGKAINEIGLRFSESMILGGLTERKEGGFFVEYFPERVDALRPLTEGEVELLNSLSDRNGVLP